MTGPATPTPDPGRPGDSVLQSLQARAGIRPRSHLRDESRAPGPVLLPRTSEGAASTITGKYHGGERRRGDQASADHASQPEGGEVHGCSVRARWHRS